MTHDMYILLSYCYILDTSHQFIRILYKIYLCANNAYRSVPMAPWPPLSKASSSSSLFSVAVLDPSLWSDLIEYSAVTMTIYHIYTSGVCFRFCFGYRSSTCLDGLYVLYGQLECFIVAIIYLPGHHTLKRERAYFPIDQLPQVHSAPPKNFTHQPEKFGVNERS